MENKNIRDVFDIPKKWRNKRTRYAHMLHLLKLCNTYVKYVTINTAE